MLLRRALVALVVLLVASGCNQGAPAPAPSAPAVEVPASGSTDGPAPTPTDPGPGTPVTSLFPQQDLAVTFRLWELGTANEVTVSQHLLPEAGRLAVIHNGRPYFAWTLDDTGLWREDPKHPGTMLRYLPPDLNDGEAWSQPSGDTSVWFQVNRNDTMCPVATGQVADGCWRLTVINRGEQLVYVLAPGIGPVQVRSTNGREPGASFRMEIQKSGAADLTPNQRSAWLGGPAARNLPRSAFTAISADQFASARDRELGFRTVTADVDGDGRPETIRGLSDGWSLADVEVSDGAAVARLSPYAWAHKVTPVRLRQPAVTVLLEWRWFPGGETAVGIRALQRSNGALEWRRLYGWGLKHAETTAATSATLNEDGVLTVEWEMGDPAGHVRVRQYELLLDQSQVRITSETLRPAGKELTYPTDPEGVLQAAYVAAIHNLQEELPRYFASEGARESFQAVAGRVPYELGGIHLVRAGAPDPYCNMTTEPAKPGPDGKAPFLIGVGGSPVITATLGTVTFGTDEKGRPVIAGVEVTGRCPNG